MQDLIGTSIQYKNKSLSVLDQRLLPQKTCWRPCNTIDDMVYMIRTLQIRGAPLIGIGACLILAHLAEQGMPETALYAGIEQLSASRPTAVNLGHCMQQVQAVLQHTGSAGIVAYTENLFAEDIRLCKRIAQHGAALIPDKASILTHCNTGSLATAGTGTAMGVIREAKAQGKDIHLWISETRPLLQGARLTAWEAADAGIPHTLICDSTAAMLMAQGRTDQIWVGCDRVAANGDTANKIGTYALAVNAAYHNVPFYVAIPHTSSDSTCPDGEHIQIEERDAAEVQGVSGHAGAVMWAAPQTPVYNPAFDITPAELITGWVSDSGVYTQQQITEQGGI